MEVNHAEEHIQAGVDAFGGSRLDCLGRGTGGGDSKSWQIHEGSPLIESKLPLWHHSMKRPRAKNSKSRAISCRNAHVFREGRRT